MSLLNKAVIKERYRQLMPVMDKMKTAGIPFVVHKGAVLSKMAYDDSFRRSSGDIDLLLPRDYFDRVKQILLEHGFSQKRLSDKGLSPVSRSEQIFHLSGTHQAAPFYKETGTSFCPYVCVDINLDIFWGESDIHVDIEEYISDRCDMELYKGTHVPVLPPEKAFLAACLHHYKDMHSIFLLYSRNGYPASHLYDILGFTVNTPLSVEKLITLADKYNARPYVYACLDAARRILPDIPTEADAIATSIYSPGFENIFFSFGLTSEERRQWPHDPKELLLDGKMREALETMLTEKEHEKIRLNTWFMG